MCKHFCNQSWVHESLRGKKKILWLQNDTQDRMIVIDNNTSLKWPLLVLYTSLTVFGACCCIMRLPFPPRCRMRCCLWVHPKWDISIIQSLYSYWCCQCIDTEVKSFTSVNISLEVPPHPPLPSCFCWLRLAPAPACGTVGKDAWLTCWWGWFCSTAEPDVSRTGLKGESCGTVGGWGALWLLWELWAGVKCVIFWETRV